MRRTTPTRTIALTALTLLVAAGCGTKGGSEAGGSGSVSPSPTPSSPSPSSPSSSASLPPSPSSSSSSPSASSSSRQDCAAATGELGAADTGHTYCLTAGDTLRVTLDGTTPRPWKPVKSDGSSLEPTNSGIVLQAGDASAAYRAVSAGTVRLTSSRPMCPSDPGRISCKGLQEWTVTVVVTKA
ncbi:hypothetical protein ACFV99_36625 [Streptomyces sp. NPDC059944]|uniref:hypothetical protein n=1 Tax=unclassified Streptomyces TaxID=2593676 RepID=UPI00364743EC